MSSGFGLPRPKPRKVHPALLDDGAPIIERAGGGTNIPALKRMLGEQMQAYHQKHKSDWKSLDFAPMHLRGLGSPSGDQPTQVEPSPLAPPPQKPQSVLRR
jgi:hypothetical protein